MNDQSKITIQISEQAAEIFCSIHAVYSKTVLKKIKILKSQLKEITSKDNFIEKEASQLADTVLVLTRHLKASKEVYKQIKNSDFKDKEFMDRIFIHLKQDQDYADVIIESQLN